jgi:hypothetical protein
MKYTCEHHAGVAGVAATDDDDECVIKALQPLGQHPVCVYM